MTHLIYVESYEDITVDCFCHIGEWPWRNICCMLLHMSLLTSPVINQGMKDYLKMDNNPGRNSLLLEYNLQFSVGQEANFYHRCLLTFFGCHKKKERQNIF